MSKLLGAVATFAGKSARTMRSLPGVGGAVLVVIGVRQLAGLGVALIVAGAFLLLLDREL